MSEFSLNTFVRQIYRGINEDDPTKLVKAVLAALEEIPQADRDLALEQALKVYCRHTLSSVRRTTPVSPGGHRSVDTQEANAAGGPIPNSARSWKTRDAVEFWRTQLNSPTWDGADVFLAFGDLAVDALDRLAEYHTTFADAHRAKALWLREWAALLRQHDVTTIKELPENVLRERLSTEAVA